MPRHRPRDAYAARTTDAVDAVDGQAYELTFNYASRPGSLGTQTDAFEIWWNEAKVGTFDPTQSVWSSASITLVGGAGDDHQEIRELAGANDSYGSLIDNLKVTSICDTKAETVHVWAFEDNATALGTNGFITTEPVGWDILPTFGNVEIQGNGYGSHSNFGAGEHLSRHGGLAWRHRCEDGTWCGCWYRQRGADFDFVAAQSLDYEGEHYATDPDATFDLVFNAQSVHTFKLAEMNGTEFTEFAFDKAANGDALVGVDGDDTIRIVSRGETRPVHRFSVDHIELQQLVASGCGCTPDHIA